MLVLHEVHTVVGEHAREFAHLCRDELGGGLAQDPGARLLYYFDHAAGSGPSYTVVTLTGLADGEALDRLVRRTHDGDLASLWRRLDRWRHEVVGKVLAPVEWSPMGDLDLSSVPADGADHEPSLYMEDTGWPSAPIDDYLAFWDTSYHRFLEALPPERRLLRIEACFRTAWGSGRHPEGILLQKIGNTQALKGLLSSTERYDPDEWPGSYMHGALALRDQWESRLLRTARWSPLH
jgi:hypothetical protein